MSVFAIGSWNVKWICQKHSVLITRQLRRSLCVVVGAHAKEVRIQYTNHMGETKTNSYGTTYTSSAPINKMSWLRFYLNFICIEFELVLLQCKQTDSEFYSDCTVMNNVTASSFVLNIWRGNIDSTA